jgi:hypothetical protein
LKQPRPDDLDEDDFDDDDEHIECPRGGHSTTRRTGS